MTTNCQHNVILDPQKVYIMREGKTDHYKIGISNKPHKRTTANSRQNNKTRLCSSQDRQY